MKQKDLRWVRPKLKVIGLDWPTEKLKDWRKVKYSQMVIVREIQTDLPMDLPRVILMPTDFGKEIHWGLPMG